MAGMLNGERVSATRQASLTGNTLRLSGRMKGAAMPQRSLSCVGLAKGIWCERRFGPVSVTVMTNNRRMIETVTDAKGREVASFAYQCDGSFRLKQ